MKTKTAYLGSRILWFFTFIALIAFSINCDSDDDDAIKDQTFFEKNDGTKWKVMDDGILIYMRINNDMTKPIELWMNAMELGKGMDDPICYYYSDDLLEIDEDDIEILENSANKLEFTYLGVETWSMTVEGDRLKMGVKSMNGEEEFIYLDRTNENLDSFEICSDDMKSAVKKHLFFRAF